MLTYTEEADGRITHSAEWFMLVLALLVVPALVFETTSSQTLRAVGFALNVAIWVGFALELAFVLAVATNRGQTLRRHWLDAVIVAVSVPIAPALLQGGRFLRLLRLTRLVRLTALGARAMQAGRRIFDRGTFRYFAAAVAILVVVAGAAVETVDTKDVPSVWDGIWWALVTVTTVGYGDVTVHSTGGRIIGIVVMVVGVTFFAMLTGAIAATFVKGDQEKDVGPVLDDILERLTRIGRAYENATPEVCRNVRGSSGACWPRPGCLGLEESAES